MVEVIDQYRNERFNHPVRERLTIQMALFNGLGERRNMPGLESLPVLGES